MKQNPKQGAVIFAGGGTGGHIYPALAIAESLGKNVRTHFVVSKREVDARVLRSARTHNPALGSTAIAAQPFSIRPKGLYRLARDWGKCVATCRELIRTMRGHGEVCVVSTGGFVAAPAVQAARVERAKVIAINLDASPGKANRWIASRAHVRLSTTRDAGPMWTTIPPIVRRDALAPGGVGACRRHLALREDVRTLLVTGGSLGAESLNAFLAAFVESDRGAKALRGWQILHQTGPKMTEDLRAAYARAGVVARVDSYLDTMGSAWGAADLCVCRAGAGNVSESWANRVPCLFMPYPYHKDAHQELNARRLGEGGRITKDHVDARANMNDAGAALEQLLTNEGARSAMRAALAALGPADGSQQASRAVLAVLSGESR